MEVPPVFRPTPHRVPRPDRPDPPGPGVRADLTDPLSPAAEPAPARPATGPDRGTLGRMRLRDLVHPEPGGAPPLTPVPLPPDPPNPPNPAHDGHGHGHGGNGGTDGNGGQGTPAHPGSARPGSAHPDPERPPRAWPRAWPAGWADRRITGAVTVDLPAPDRFVEPDRLVLSGLAWHRAEDPARTEEFVRALVRARAGALAAGEARYGHVPADLTAACARHGLPLLAVDVDLSFATITEHVRRTLTGARVGTLTALVDRHRRLTTEQHAGTGADAILDLLRTELDLSARILSPTGRQIAGALPALPENTAAALAARFLTAQRAALRPPHRTTARSTAYSLFPVRSGPVARPAITDWFIAVEADTDQWHGERLDLVDRLARLVAAERGGRDTERLARRRTAGRLLTLLESTTSPGPGQALLEEAAARLATGGRLAEPSTPHLPGAVPPPAPTRRQLVTARLAPLPGDGPGFAAGIGPGDGPGPAGAAPTPPVPGGPERPGPSAPGPTPTPTPTPAPGTGRRPAGPPPVAELLAEILLHPRCLGPEAADRIAVTPTGDGREAVAFVLLDADETLTPDALRRVANASLPRGLWPDEALTLGTGGPVEDAAELHHALAEARNARQIAEGQLGGVPTPGGPGSGRGERRDREARRARELRETLAARAGAGMDRPVRTPPAAPEDPTGTPGPPGPLGPRRGQGAVAVCGPEDLAAHVMALLPLIPAEVRRAFSRRLLAPLHEYDRRYRSDLVPTLRAFLEHDGSWARCGAALHLHVNSLRYRISRIEALTGRNLGRLEDKMDFAAALRMR
ncbi:helix-turn-helix domain-containing protein [Streptomyces sp. BI20]|uniref:helix-turn-helix domain-containing protein n=1 Tax=Streptomyces sp. BI20 TaxID=3403460 RepID=UPI003C762E43